MPEELWTVVHDIVQEAVIKTITKKKKCKMAKWSSQEADKVVWYSHLFQKFSTVCCDPQVKVFGIVDEAEVDVFLGLFCFFDVSADVGNLISGSSAFSKSSLNICNRFNALDLIRSDRQSA